MDLILSSINVDFDCLAAAVAAQKMYPNSKICLQGGNQENVNKFIKKYKDKFPFIKAKKVRRDQISRLILVDNSRLDRLGNFSDLARSGQLPIHIFDHHLHSDLNPEAEFKIIMSVGATTTIMVEELIKKGVNISPFEATLFALGIYEDTGNFVHISTTERDMKACAYLLSCGADLKMIKEYLDSSNLNIDQLKLLNTLLQNIETHQIRGINIAIAVAECDDYVNEAAILAGKIERHYDGFLVIFLVIKMVNRIYVIGRSVIESVHVGKILEKMGGGGHFSAAAATVRKDSLIEQKQRLIKLLEDHVYPMLTARDIMNAPVDSVPETESVKNVRTRLMMMHHKYMCILDANRKLMGIVTKTDVAKAVSQGFGERNIRICMTARVITAEYKATYNDLQRLMIHNKIGSVPILRKKRLVGIVTREDLLMAAARMNINQVEYELPPEFDFDDAGPHLRKRLSSDMMRLLSHLGEAGNTTGMGVYLVGGFVRDLLLKQKNYDIDIVVEGDAIEFAEFFCERYMGKRMTFKRKTFRRFQTVVLSLPDSYIKGGLKIDITTARLERYQHPGALPEVETSSIKNDLYRRDFTINAIAVQINHHRFGHIFDLFGGRRDLSLRVLRALHNGSFYDDPTRILRAIRFEQRFGFSIDKNTESLLKIAAEDKILKRVAAQRIREELINILSEEKPYHAVKRLGEFKILEQIHPKIAYNKGVFHLFEEIHRVLIWYKMEFRHHKIKPWVIYLLGMTSKMQLREAEKFVDKLTWHRHVKNKIFEMITHKEQVIAALSDRRGVQNSHIYDTLHLRSAEVMLYLMADSKESIVEEKISHYFHALANFKVKTTGKEIIEMGVESGPEIGRILRYLLHRKLDGLAPTHQDELKIVQQLVEEKSHRLSRGFDEVY
ncbi:MAG: hypothetical protein B6244_07000 [Candidatus Cloacimonetes bacterium 4572_55]|nr:MAG: hypothetical protein B6244_07000 [Candidatus Cloacimonetes bacterium 4572_55]